MIKFEFCLDDFEAENLFEILDDAINCALFETFSTDRTIAEQKWFERRAAYLKSLKSKLSNRRVPSHD